MAIALDTLAYARRLREAGFSEQQADGQAEALAAAMTDSLATKQDLIEWESRIESRLGVRFGHIDERFAQVDGRLAQIEIRIDELEKRIEIRFREQAALYDVRLADMERRMTVRLGGMMVAAIGAASALVRLL